MRIVSWMVTRAGAPMVEEARDQEAGPGEVLIEVAGCGVCHTDLGFMYDGVPTRHALPLALGHEVSGRVVEAGAGAEHWLGRSVVVPAVIPCGECPACAAGRGSICRRQVFPGNDVHGGFATHLCVPARGLCPVPDLSDRRVNPLGIDLASLSVIADAVSTPYQAIVRSQLGAGDLAVFVGVGGVGGFGVQVAAARGARVIAIDVDDARLQRVAGHGAMLSLNAARLPSKELRATVREVAKREQLPSWRHKIFETSGTPAGQSTAFGLLGPGAYLSVVGYTPRTVEVCLSHLMAFDAVVQGNWGCLPEHYPAVVELVLSGKVQLAPFVEQRPLSTINDVFTDLHQRGLPRRVVLVPER